MIELNIKHKRGKKTFTYLIFRHGWWLIFLGLGCFYLAGSIYFGLMHSWTENFLNSHPDWYITVEMLSEWLIMLGISFLIIAYLLVNVHYRMYKFILDEFAVHLHKGLFFTRETTIPYRHISNVRIDRPYHYKMFGIAKVDIVTAADRNVEKPARLSGEFLIPIIDTRLARELARQILETASKHKNGGHNKDEDEGIDQDIEENDDFEDDYND